MGLSPESGWKYMLVLFGGNGLHVIKDRSALSVAYHDI